MEKKYSNHLFITSDFLTRNKFIVTFFQFLFVFFLSISNNYAQVANYVFSETSGTYTNLVSPTNAINSGWDDAVTTNTIPIGFTFNYSGTNYTNCSINSNGFITFGATTSAANNFLPISTNTGYERAIVALGVDIIDDNSRAITYLTTGSSPNRVFTVQWREVVRVGRGGRFNFQIQLNETTNLIKIVYGNCAPNGNNNQNINVQVGLRGASNADFNNRSLTTNAVVWDNNTIAGTINTAACRTRNSNNPNSGRTFIWSPIFPPTVISLGSSSGCSGSVITINGTNFAGVVAANVRIGGTAVTNILTNTGTQITVTIGAGTTGLVTVQNPAGTGTSASTFTVNVRPVITVQPATPLSICAGVGSRTISVTATGATIYQWRKNGVNLTNVAPFSNVTTATLTITTPATIDAGTYDVIVGNASSCSVTSNGVVLTVTTVPTIATTPTPTDAATGLCFSGLGAVSNVSWAAVAGAVNYDVFFGAGSLPGSVTSANLVGTTYNTGVLAASTTYFWRIIAKNTCGSAVWSSTWTFTTLATACICQPSNLIGPGSADQISNVTLGVLNNTSGGATAFPFYTFYNALPIPDIQRGATHPVYVTMGGDLNQYAAVWIDYNNDGNFTATEGVAPNTNAGPFFPLQINITVPAGATLGNFRMRVRGGTDSSMNTNNGCSDLSSMTTQYGETEDYIVNIVPAISCTTPAAPTSISLSANNTSISGTFTFPSPTADEYIVVRSVNPVAPTPANGTTYTVGGTMGAGYTVIDRDINNIFTTSGLTSGVTYYFYVFSIRTICTGRPFYSAVLSGNIATTALSQGCITATSSSRSLLINSFKTVGNLTNVSNVNTGYTNSGYTDYTSLPTTTQIPGGGINAKYETNFSATFKAWVDWDRNGTFDDILERVYDSGSFIAASTSFGFTVPASAIGNYRLRIRTYSGTFSLNQPCGNLGNGETEDYRLTIVADCAAKITNVVDGKRCDTGTIVLSASATPSTTEFRWYDSEVGGTLIATTLKIGLTNDTDWITPSLSATTTYWVEAWSPTCASFFREKVIAKVNVTSIITFNPVAPIVCGENSIISVSATGDFEVIDLINEDFEGSAQLVTVNATSTGLEWTTKPSTFVPSGTALWRPAINSRNAGNNFAYTCSNLPSSLTECSLVSNTLNTTSFTDLTLTFRHYFSYYPVPGDNGYVEISTNGGPWTAIQNYKSDLGEAGSFETVTILLQTYINQSNLKIRFYYKSEGGNGWCIDDIRLFGTKPINTTFTWGGGADAYADAAATIPYDPMTMSLNTVYIKPTPAQLASASWTFTANATIANGCVVSKPVTLTNKTRKWLGSTTNWNSASNWEPALIPDITNCVIVPNNTIISGSNYTAYGKNLNVKATGTLTVQSGNNLIIEDLIKVDTGGIFNLENNSSLIQTNNVTNLGDINYNRITSGVRGYDYIYWSSPVLNQNINTLYSSPPQGPKYFWNTIGPNPNGGQGYWNDANALNMNVGQGYIVRASNQYYMPSTPVSSNFKGVPNNGNLSIKARLGNMTTATVPSVYSNSGLDINNDNWSLLGNPYPSAINGLQFLSTNSANIVGTLYLWRHLNDVNIMAPVPFYQNYAYNYNSSDYLSFNFTGPTTPGASEIIKTGQAFMIQRKEGPQDLTGVDILFNNAMRVNAGAPYANDLFFRSSTPVVTQNTSSSIERHRIWLDLIDDSTQLSETTLLGYIEGATYDFDNLFDGPFAISNLNKLYSFVDDKKLIIQGRQLPFDNNDQVPLAMNIVANGNFHIGINTVDGLFTNQDIYLQDNLLNITHDLKLAPYSFSSTIGTFADRFVLKYVNTNLATTNFETNNDLKVLTSDKISLSSSNLLIKKIEVFDLLGRKIDGYDKVNSKLQTLDNLYKSNRVLIIKTTLENDVIISKKIIF